MAALTLQQLRNHAISHSLFRPTTLKQAILRLGFVQADPIRSPARAQDLILRHRVKNYCAGDLEQRYPSLDIEEDVLYAYGFLPRNIWHLLHPRNTRDLSPLEHQVFAVVSQWGETHPRELEAHLGCDRVINAWGGYSKSTTRALEGLHHRGLLRIVRRENGIRVYGATLPFPEPISSQERMRKLILTLVNIFEPVPEKSLSQIMAPLRRAVPDFAHARMVIADLHREEQLQKQTVEGLTYLWTAPKRISTQVPNSVRFLAPFDPLVWDRRRFQHLWGWPYRFEAYTPVAKRLRGYYAMPLLWKDSMVGWANVTLVKKRLQIKLGFVGKRPKDADFRWELDQETVRMKSFLNGSATEEMLR